jgi:hypothetical protein
MSEAKGIKELSEVLDAIPLIVVPVKKAFADGKISSADLPELLALIKEHQKILSALDGISSVIDEAKDLSSSELEALGLKAWAVIKQIKDA